MDHVTYVLIMFRCVLHMFANELSLKAFFSSISFFLYTFIVFLIHLYSTTGRNAVDTPRTTDANIELTPTPIHSKWYARVPNTDPRYPLVGNHVIGEDEEE